MHLYVGLLHYPVYNRNYQVIASAITTFDLHDISRLAKTYGVNRFFVITPLKDQQKLTEQVKKHWTDGYGAKYNKHRKESLELLEIASTLKEATNAIVSIEGKAPLVIATDASKQGHRSISYKKAGNIIQEGTAVIVIFGTAWGLSKDVIEETDYVLDPIMGKNDYNHLSVRAAAAITLDRLVGRFFE
jgi:hypothetical protein